MSRVITIGGGTGLRLFLLAVSVAVCASSPATVAAGSEREPQIAVREEKGVFIVSAQFEIPQTPAIALSVLMDYERIPRFMPGVTTSVIRRRSAGRALVEQEAVARVMFFSKKLHLILDVHETENALVFKDCAGRSFTRYEGAWRVSRLGGLTIVRYELSAKPNFDVPGFLLRRLLKRDAGQMIDALRVEFAARQGHVVQIAG